MKERLRKLLARRKKRRIVDADRVPSSVLLPLYEKEGQYHILFIKRTETVREHKGQISFPGGTREEGETGLDTALRESEEEIGLRAEDADVIGELDDELTTTSSYIVSPFVAFIPWPYHFRISRDEVDEIIEVPVAALADRKSLHEDTELLDGREVASYTYHYRGRVIWGATARILKHLLDIYNRALQES